MLHFLFITILHFAIPQQEPEIKIVRELMRLRNEHKADSAELLYADTVLVYMKYMRNVPKRVITQSDKVFWKTHPKYRFEITTPIQITTVAGNKVAVLSGKEFLDGVAIKKEKIEIKFDRHKKINYFRAYLLK